MKQNKTNNKNKYIIKLGKNKAQQSNKQKT